MKITAIALAAAGLAASGAVLAQSAEDLIKKNGCSACHSNDKKIVGPAYADVAAKYKGDAGAAARLMEKVKKGGRASGARSPCRRIPTSPTPTSRSSSPTSSRSRSKWLLSSEVALPAILRQAPASTAFEPARASAFRRTGESAGFFVVLNPGFLTAAEGDGTLAASVQESAAPGSVPGAAAEGVTPAIAQAKRTARAQFASGERPRHRG